MTARKSVSDSNVCSCGGYKASRSPRCWKCFVKSFPDADTRKAHQKAYSRNYMRDYRAGKLRTQPHCRYCGRPIHRHSQEPELCYKCKGKGNLTSRAGRYCPTCEVRLERKDWHGRKYLRCPGCGLERNVLYLEGEREEKELEAA